MKFFLAAYQRISRCCTALASTPMNGAQTWVDDDIDEKSAGQRDPSVELDLEETFGVARSNCKT